MVLHGTEVYGLQLGMPAVRSQPRQMESIGLRVQLWVR